MTATDAWGGPGDIAVLAQAPTAAAALDVVRDSLGPALHALDGADAIAGPPRTCRDPVAVAVIGQLPTAVSITDALMAFVDMIGPAVRAASAAADIDGTDPCWLTVHTGLNAVHAALGGFTPLAHCWDCTHAVPHAGLWTNPVDGWLVPLTVPAWASQPWLTR